MAVVLRENILSVNRVVKNILSSRRCQKRKGRPHETHLTPIAASIILILENIPYLLSHDTLEFNPF